MPDLLVIPSDPDARRAAMRAELRRTTSYDSTQRRRSHAIRAMIYALECYRDAGIEPPWANQPDRAA
jgi:hypothetical protein